MSKLEVIRAGAGSGKTTALCNIVAEAVAKGLDPSRILATTFTKKAAAELKSRMQSKLLKEAGDLSGLAFGHADRFDLAVIGTVHSVGAKLLSRYALEMGLSPTLEVLDESGSNNALRELLGQVDEKNWVQLSDAAMKLSIMDLPSRLLKLLEIKRGNRLEDAYFCEQMKLSATRLCAILGPTNPTLSDNAGVMLLEFAQQALNEISQLNDSTDATHTAKSKLRRLASQQMPSWTDFVEAKKIVAGKRSGANTILDPLRGFAGQVRNHPELHRNIQVFSELLADETIRLSDHYLTFKRERGFVDYIDLEILLLDLLSNEQIQDQIRCDFDLVLVDEFQDTNPLQLAIFMRLRSLMQRNCWVGDPKQAIYSFRDTDPELVNHLWTKARDLETRDLKENYRSQKGIVQFVGRVFAPSLGNEARQDPMVPGIAKGLERWLIDASNNADEASALASGLVQLKNEGERFGDIAILSRTNSSLSDLANALDSFGIPYLLESPGLFSTREGALVLAGLRLTADRNDSLAAATILHLLSDPEIETPTWLADRLREVREQNDQRENRKKENRSEPSKWLFPWHGNVMFEKLEKLNREILPPSVLVQQVIEALELPTRIAHWEDPVRRYSHLDSILKHARSYEDTSLSAGEASTLTGLILYFEELGKTDADHRHPPIGHDAVTLMTYHAAKGLEWPIVILTGLDSERAPDLWIPVAHGGNHSEVDPLEGRQLRYWIWPFGNDNGPFKRQIRGSGLDEDVLETPEGVLARTKSIEESIRLLYVGCTRAKRKLVFAHRTNKYEWLKRIEGIDSILDPDLSDGEYPLDDIDTTMVIRRLGSETEVPFASNSLSSIWFSKESRGERVHERRIHSPSSEEPNQPCTLRVEALTGSSLFPSGAKEEDYSSIGDATHTYLGAIPSMLSFSEEQKVAAAARCIAGFEVTGKMTPSMLMLASDRFCQWVDKQYPNARWLTEVPVVGSRIAGGYWRGAIDLVLVLQDGGLVIIDHKSAPIRREQCEAKARSYTGQLLAYEQALISHGESVVNRYIHFPFAGTIVEVTI